MQIKSILFGLALVMSYEAQALSQGHMFHKESLLMQSRSQKSHALKLRADGSLRTQEILRFNQVLDHKNPSKGTFKQRYFIDSQYAADSSSPVFYIICGEWNCAGTGSYGFAENLAKKEKAHLVALEHRFYGESLPMTTLTSENLKNLNIESAIEDLAVVQRFIMGSRNLNGKWIAFGGSYAGTLAAVYREKHPELVAGAHASSAPVLMKNEFFEYDAHVAKVINQTTCGDEVREAVRLIEEKLKTPEGTAEVKRIFQSEELVNNNDFLYVVADMLAAAVQYGQERLLCGTLNATKDKIQGYAFGGLAVLRSMGNTPFEISLAVAERIEVTPQDNMRQWLWQSCQEFGWFQVANEGTKTSRSSRIDLAYHEEICERLYQRPMVKDGALNAEYYLPLFDPQTSHIIFSNGSNDPWLTLSITNETEPKNTGLDLFMIDGAAHCNDLRIYREFPAVSAAQVELELIIKSWLK